MSKTYYRPHSSISSITFGDKVTMLGDYAFADNHHIRTLFIPSNIKHIGKYAFAVCPNLSEVILSEGVKTIEEGAFQFCESLTSIHIPSSVEHIGEAVFVGCDKLKSFSGKFASTDGRCLVVNGNLIAFAPSEISQYDIPEEISKIGAYVFCRCMDITKITIPKSLEVIEESAYPAFFHSWIFSKK